MNKNLKLIPLTLLGVSCLAGCNKSDTIFIFTAHEENRIEQFNKELKEHFPKYDIQVVSKTTGALMSELQAQGKNTECDIFVGIEITNAEILLQENPDLFADLSDYDTSNYVDEVLEYQKDITLPEFVQGKNPDGTDKIRAQTVRKGHKKISYPR